MNSILKFCLKNRWLVMVFMAVLFISGTIAFLKLNIEAYPDPVPPMVEIVTQNPGQSAEEIERYITSPIEVQMAGIPHVSVIRSNSVMGLSDIKVQFTYEFTREEAEQKVINRLSQLQGLPAGIQPQISPTSPIGEIYRYRLEGTSNYSLTDLKTLQDWVVRRKFKSVPGVIDVAGWGGRTKTFDVVVDRKKLASYGLGLPQVVQALNNANGNVGGQTINIGPQAAIVRSIGSIRSMDQMRQTVLKSVNGNPITIADVAEVKVGALPRLGGAGQDKMDDIVEGIVLMQRGAESMPTIKAVEAAVKEINETGILPPGVKIEKIYDRSDLIELTTHTVLHNMLEGMILIFLVQWIFLGDLKSALIVSASIPFALFFAVLIMTMRGESANLLSVGAIDFGLVVDATVIMVEAIFRNLAEHDSQSANPARRLSAKLATISDAGTGISKSIFFAASIIIVSFLPLFMLSGVAGHIFGPMARTYAYAIAGGLLATFTITPALSALILPLDLEEKDTPAVKFLRKLYRPMLDFSLKNRVATLGVTGVLLASTGLAASGLGLEFLPHLEEGNFWIRATMPTSVSLEASDDYVNKMRTTMLEFPEVVTVISQHGRPDDGTDTSGFNSCEFFVPLKPSNTWPGHLTKEQLTEKLNKRLRDRFPGVDFNFSQTIQDNVEEAASGVKGENSIKLFGSDLETLEATARKIEKVMATVPGVTDLEVLRVLGQPTVNITINRAKAARYGLSSSDINTTVQAALAGQQAGVFYEDGSDRNFPIQVRLNPKQRQSIDDIKTLGIPATAPDGSSFMVPLASIAEIKFASSASLVYREGQLRYIPIKYSVRGRDLGGAVKEAQDKVAKEVTLPGGYRLEWVGELGNLEAALKQLSIAIPISFLLIAFLLYLNFHSIRDTLLAVSVLPMAMVGGILALSVTHTPLSVSAAIGFIGLFGISIMAGIIVLGAFNRFVAEGKNRVTALHMACETQMRPVIMTCVAACVGLLPAAVATGIGSQVQKPLALVVVGGVLLAPVLILTVLPVLIDMFSDRGRHPKPHPHQDSEPSSPAHGATLAHDQGEA